MSFYLPLESYFCPLDYVFYYIFSLKLNFLSTDITLIQIFKDCDSVAAKEHLVVNHVKKLAKTVIAGVPDAQVGSFFLRVFVLEAQHLLKTIGEGRDSNQSYSSVQRGCHNYLTRDPGDWSKILSVVFAIVVPHIFASLDIEEGQIAGVSGHHDDPVLGAELEASHFYFFLDIDCPNHFEGFLSLSADSDFIVKTIADEDVHFGLGVLGSNEVSYLPSMFC